MKRLMKLLSIVACLVLAMSLMAGCGSKPTATEENNTPSVNENQPSGTEAPAATHNYSGKKALFVNSYHKGYEWSDGLVNGVKEIMDKNGVEMQVFYMDTKMHKDKAFAENKAKEVAELAKTYKPDVIFATDDNAAKYVVAPYFKDSATPVITMGINWDQKIYGMPFSNTTSMLEWILPVPTINAMKDFAKGTRIGYMGEPTETGHKDLQGIKDNYGVKIDKEYFPKDYAEFKQMYTQAQSEVDMLIFENYVGIQDFDTKDAKSWVMENTKIPTGAVYTWVTPYTVVGVCTDAPEFTKWAGEAALKIFDGTPVSQIATTQNKTGVLYVNKPFADKMGYQFKAYMLNNAKNPPEQ